jgi:hypothetical protein
MILGISRVAMCSRTAPGPREWTILGFTNENDSHYDVGMKKRNLLAAVPAFALAVFAATAFAADEPEVLLVIKNHRFDPAEVKVPSGKRVKLVVHNQDPTPEEFESHELNREKVVPAGTKATIFIGPLKAGRYPFYGEYNEATAKGVVVAE